MRARPVGLHQGDAVGGQCRAHRVSFQHQRLVGLAGQAPVRGDIDKDDLPVRHKPRDLGADKALPGKSAAVRRVDTKGAATSASPASSAAPDRRGPRDRRLSNSSPVTLHCDADTQAWEISVAHDRLTARLDETPGYQRWMDTYIAQANAYGETLGRAPIASRAPVALAPVPPISPPHRR